MTTLTAAQPGPITLDIHLTYGTITITAEHRQHAQITATGVDNLGATETPGTLRLRLTVPSTVVSGGSVVCAGHGNNITIGNLRGGVFIAGNNYGPITTGVRGGFASTVIGGGPVEIRAALPEGSSLVVNGANVDVQTSGNLDTVRVSVKSGGIEVDAAGVLDVSTYSGDVTVRRLCGSGRAQSKSGDVTIHAVADGTINASTASGDVRVTREPGVVLDVEARSASGCTRIS